MIDPTAMDVKKLFVLSFKLGDDPAKDYFDKYYMATFEIKDFNVSIENKPFFDQPIKKQARRL